MPEDVLLVGLADGTLSARIDAEGMWVNRSNFPVVRGPVSGEVLYGRIVDGGIDLHLVRAATGADRLVARVPATAEDAEIGPAGDDIYWIDGSSASGGVWHLDVDSAERTRVLPRMEAAVELDGAVVASVAHPHAQLALSADGTRLAALWCGIEHCLLQLIRFGDDAIEAMPLAESWHDLLGFAGERVSLGDCADVAAQTLRDGECPGLDAAATAAYWGMNFAFGVELSSRWHPNLIHDPDAEPMSFTLLLVAVPDSGGDAVPLDALGELHGQ